MSVTIAPVLYLASLPQPLVAGHQNRIDPGLSRSAFRPGRQEQSERYQGPVESFLLNFDMDESEYDNWLAFVEANAWTAAGVTIQLAGFGNTAIAGTLDEFDVQFTSRLQVNSHGDNRLQARVSANVLQ